MWRGFLIIVSALILTCRVAQTAPPRDYFVLVTKITPPENDLPIGEIPVTVVKVWGSELTNPTRELEISETAKLDETKSVYIVTTNIPKEENITFAYIQTRNNPPFLNYVDIFPKFVKFKTDKTYQIDGKIIVSANNFRNFVEDRLLGNRRILRNQSPLMQEMRDALNFYDWYHSNGIVSKMNITMKLQDSLHDHALLVAKLVGDPVLSDSLLLQSIVNIDTLPGFDHLSNNIKAWIYNKIAIELSKKDANLLIEERGRSIFETVIFFHERAASVRLEEGNISQLSKEVQHIYQYMDRTEDSIGAADRLKKFFMSDIDESDKLNSRTARTFLGKWLDLILIESGHGEFSEEALVNHIINEPRLCGHWSDLGVSLTRHHYAWTTSGSAHLTLGKTIAASVKESGGACG